MSTNNSTWDISTDIYKISETTNNLKNRYIEDQDAETLAIGIFGYIGDVESKKIQTAVIMTGELGNEMFPTRAKLSKNILTHAIYQNITDINARPAEVVANIAIKTEDFDFYAVNGQFIFDRKCAINIGAYEFHFDYDVILQKSQTAAMANPVYSARYDMTHDNPISNVTSPYLNQPYLIQMYNSTWIIFQATLRQTTLEWTEDQLVTASIIDNKTFSFNFTNQLAGFNVYVTENGKTTRLTPYFNGAPIDESEEYYCRYLYIDDSTVRITFDVSSYIPGLNAKILVEAYTTLGVDGNFSYNYDDASATDYVDFDSDTYGYSNVTGYCRCITDSVDGRNRKDTAELKKLVPKFALSRGYITTETDLNNYFNLINTDTNRLKLQKKVDNQLERIWYAYFLIKDDFGNIIPTNTLKLELDTLSQVCYSSDDSRIVLPAGTYFHYNRINGVAKIISPDQIPTYYSDEYFDGINYYYMSVYNIILNPDPLYAAFYMTAVNSDNYFVYEWVNENSDIQFIANRNNIQRKLLSDQNTYRFTFSMTQSVNADFGLYTEEEDEGGNIIITNKTKCILVMYREGEPYRYAEGKLIAFHKDDFLYDWEFTFETDNSLDNENYLKLLDLGIVGSTEHNYGYFENQFGAKLYILAELDQEFGRYDLDSIVPGLEGYTLTNIYDVHDGISIYKNYTNMMNTKVEPTSATTYNISGVPLVGAHYMTDEEHVMYFMDALDEKKSYIDNCLEVVENSFDIDLKFFNTYGLSLTYSIGDKANTDIGPIDIKMKFRLSLVSDSDVYTKDEIIQYIKNYIEDINDFGDLHIPNMLSDIRKEFGDAINWIEYMNFNDFWLGVNHIILREVEDPHTVPEFINIRNQYDEEGNLIPCIEIETVTYTSTKTS